MAITPLQTRSANTISNEVQRLYAAWRFAKAAWDAELYAPENCTSDMPDEINDRHADLCFDALNAFLLHPAETISDLALKLRIFRDEEIQSGWHKASAIVGVLAEDARRIALR